MGKCDLSDLVQKLMSKNVQERLTDTEQIKSHAVFKDLVDWTDMQKFIEIDTKRVSEEEQEIMEFYEDSYLINKYSDDIGNYCIGFKR